MENLANYLNIDLELLGKLTASLSTILVLILIKIAANIIIRNKIPDPKRAYYYRRATLYVFSLLAVLFVGPIWIEAIDTLTTFLGLVSAGIAIAMHDTIANIAGWGFIISRRPFKVGDRIQIGDTAGDVIDMRLFQFSIIEIGNWVDAEQSTGRIIHIPNSKVLREPLANYEIGFEHIWNEIPVMVTFESNKAEHLSEGAQEQIRRAAERYLIFYGKLTPIVYTTVKDSGVLLTARYIVKPRQRRSSEQEIWEAILDAFDEASDIDLAYPTTRFYRAGQPNTEGN
ncbi:mechanosensitive ion channel family protein [Candidatus Sumerlaeota bacterium]